MERNLKDKYSPFLTTQIKALHETEITIHRVCSYWHSHAQRIFHLHNATMLQAEERLVPIRPCADYTIPQILQTSLCHPAVPAPLIPVAIFSKQYDLDKHFQERLYRIMIRQRLAIQLIIRGFQEDQDALLMTV
jgi:hypothetical protein